jgi:uncharacterized protein with GYD domain
MPKYLIVASLNVDGVKGVLDKGGVARRDAITKLIADAGGTLESFYFAFGEEDVYATVDLPNNETVAAIAMNVAASGSVSCKTVVLLTPEEVDRAAAVNVDYRPPGS